MVIKQVIFIYEILKLYSIIINNFWWIFCLNLHFVKFDIEYETWKVLIKRHEGTRLLRLATYPTPPNKKMNWPSPITPIKFVKSEWQCNTITYIGWLTILQNLNKIHGVLSELCPQNQVWWMHGQTPVFLCPIQGSD